MKNLKKTLKIVLITVVIFNIQLISHNCFGQDVHFTMIDKTPTLLNPATAGVFDGNLRTALNYRNQWSSIGNPYRTYSFGIDGGLFKGKWSNGYLGAGLNVFKDVAGATNFGKTSINLALSSVVFIDRKNSFSLGLVSSWAQTSLSSTNLRWGNQFDGQKYDGSISSSESVSLNDRNYFDFSAGGLWNFNTTKKSLHVKDKTNVQVGFAFYHFTKPSLKTKTRIEDKLYSKWAIHSQSNIGVTNSKFTINPKILIMIQGPTKEVTIGTMFKRHITEKTKYTGEFKGLVIAFGGYYRFGDALSPSIEIELATFSFGISYDINLSGLTVATQGKGGMEIYLKFVNPNPIRKRRYRF